MLRRDELDPNDATRPMQLWARLYRFALVYKSELVRLGLTALVLALCDAGFPLVTGRVVDAVAASEDGLSGFRAALTTWGPAYLALTLVLPCSVFVFIRLAGRLSTHVAHDIRRAAFGNLSRLSLSYFDHRPVGWLLSRMTSDCDRLARILAWGTVDLVWGFAVMGSVALLMFLTDVRLALVGLAVIPVLAWVSISFKRRILRTARTVRQTNSRLTATYNETISGLRTTRVFAREKENLADFQALAGEMHGASVSNALLSAVYLPIVMSLAAVATALALTMGGLDVDAGRITLGTLVAFLMYLRLFFDPVQEVAQLLAEMQMARAAAERVLGLIEAEPEIRDSPAVLAALARYAGGPEGAGAARSAGGVPLAPDGLPDRIDTLELRGVSFAYATRAVDVRGGASSAADRDGSGEGRSAGGEIVLRDVDLRVTAGETIALVGPTGGGKTTLVSLLARYYEPTRGAVLVDGVDVRERSLEWLQSRVAVVPQAPYLFRGSVLENIRYGRLEATDEEVRAAARTVGADTFLERLEQGFETEVGEGGGRLSTGEKQLVSFARALLASRPVLILDEATSSVDTETERAMQAALEVVLAGRTAFVIAHRLSTVRRADRILYVEGGQIVEQGTHRELLARGGKYHALATGHGLRPPVESGAEPPASRNGDAGATPGAWGPAPAPA